MGKNSLQGRHVVITANTSWCIAHFRGTVVDTLMAQGCRVTILAPRDKYSDDLAKRGCEFVDIEMDRTGLSPLRDFALMRRFRRHFQALKPDAIFSYTIKNNIYGAIAARRFGIPFIAVIPGLGNAFSSDNWLQKLAVGLYRFAFRNIHLALFSNVENKEVFVSKGLLDADRCIVLDGEGVNTTDFAFATMPPAPPWVFLFCARLLYSKGLAEFVSAAKSIRAHAPDTQFHILGKLADNHPEGIEQSKLDEWIAQGDVQFLGETPDVRPFITAAHCVVLPSYYQEGMPRILLDATSLGRLVITTDTPGCRETLIDGETGFLCPAQDAATLTKRIEQVMSLTDDALQNMGQNARNLAQTKFDDRITANVYLDILQGVFENETVPKA